MNTIKVTDIAYQNCLLSSILEAVYFIDKRFSKAIYLSYNPQNHVRLVVNNIKVKHINASLLERISDVQVSPIATFKGTLVYKRNLKIALAIYSNILVTADKEVTPENGLGMLRQNVDVYNILLRFRYDLSNDPKVKEELKELRVNYNYNAYKVTWEGKKGITYLLYRHRSAISASSALVRKEVNNLLTSYF